MDDKQTRPSALGRIGEISAWAISVVAWAISYESQAALAQREGRFAAGWEAWAWPMTVDLASLAAMVLALDQARRGRRSTVAWTIAVVSALVMVAANIVSAWGSAIAVGMHMWPPLIALGSWYLLVHDRRGPGRMSDTSTDDRTLTVRADNPDMLPDHRGDSPRVATPEPDAEADRWTAAPDTGDMPARARVQTAVAAIQAAGEEPTTDRLAAALGVSERHVRRIVNGTQKRTELKR